MMRRIAIITILICSIAKSSLFATPLINPTDTVYIDLGDNRKIAIVVEDIEDLKALEEYDLNQMITELNLHADSTVFNPKKKEKSKDKADKDTTYYFHRKKADINLEFANYEIEIASNDFDDLGDDIEDLFENYRGAEREETIDTDVPKHDKGYYIDLGLNNWIEDGGFSNNDLYGVKPWGSWYIALKRVHRNKVGRNDRAFINWGYGVSWYNWKFENRNTRINEGETGLIITEDNTVSGIKSKLTASYLNFEVIPTIDFSSGKRKKRTLTSSNVKIIKYRRYGFRMGIGPYIGYRLGSKTKVVYRINGDKRKDKEHDNFFLSNVRYGLRAIIGINRTDLFINYDLNKVFNSGRGPELNAISFGIIL